MNIPTLFSNTVHMAGHHTVFVYDVCSVMVLVIWHDLWMILAIKHPLFSVLLWSGSLWWLCCHRQDGQPQEGSVSGAHWCLSPSPATCVILVFGQRNGSGEGLILLPNTLSVLCRLYRSRNITHPLQATWINDANPILIPFIIHV